MGKKQINSGGYYLDLIHHDGKFLRNVINRHPNMEDRPVMCEILQQLQKPDFHILKWTKEDKEKYSEEARTLGAPLDCGHELYKDLQTIYLPVAQNETEESCESEQDYL